MKITEESLRQLVLEEFDSRYAKRPRNQKKLDRYIEKALDKLHSVGRRQASSISSMFTDTRVRVDTRRTEYLRKLYDQTDGGSVVWEGVIEKIDFDIEQMHDSTEIVFFATVVLDDVYAESLGMKKVAVDIRGLSL